MSLLSGGGGERLEKPFMSIYCRPNLITFLGLSFVVLALGVAYIYTPDLVGPGPAWIYFLYDIAVVEGRGEGPLVSVSYTY